MVKFDISLNEKGYGSIPKELRDSWGKKLRIIPNDSAGVIFGKSTPLEDVEKSVEILLEDVRHRREKEERRKKSTIND